MSDEKWHYLRLSPARGAFFDPVTRLNLTTLTPQDRIPAGQPISGSILAALASGGIQDVFGTIPRTSNVVTRNESEELPNGDTFPVDTNVKGSVSSDVQESVMPKQKRRTRTAKKTE